MERGEKIRKLEEEIKNTKYNKATQYHIGKLKAKLAGLKEEQEKKRASGGKVLTFRKSGDATVIIVGFPSVGKSTLLNKLTAARSKTGDYEFTTLDAIPGVMRYKSAAIQILDIPGILTGAASGRGRGKEVLSFLRNADLILIMVDGPGQFRKIEGELYDSGFRLNKGEPDVVLKKTKRGGINISSTVKLKNLDERMIKVVLKERGIHNADILIREDLDLERFIDALSKNRVYVKSLAVFNKVDVLGPGDRKALPENFIQISSLTGEGINGLKDIIWENLGLMRVYTKKTGEEPDRQNPLIIKKGSRISDAAEKIHGDLAGNLEYARIWGPSSRFPGQRVGPDRRLEDGDVVELHMK